jgi:hypothetical protein
MRVVHKNEIPEESDLIKLATKQEKAGQLDVAITTWNLLLNEHPAYTRGYDRLMILYRKKRDYKKELKIIQQAIKGYQERNKERQPKYGAKVISLSKSLLKATGLGDSKGNSLYQPGELSKWTKRADLVRKRIAALAAKKGK